MYIAPPCPLPQMQGNVCIFFLLIGHVSKCLSSLLFANATEVLSWSADKRLECLNLTMRLEKEDHRTTIQIFLFVIWRKASSKNWSKKKHYSLQTFHCNAFLLFVFYFKHAAFYVKIFFVATYAKNWFPRTVIWNLPYFCPSNNKRLIEVNTWLLIWAY